MDRKSFWAAVEKEALAVVRKRVPGAELFMRWSAHNHFVLECFIDIPKGDEYRTAVFAVSMMEGHDLKSLREVVPLRVEEALLPRLSSGPFAVERVGV